MLEFPRRDFLGIAAASLAGAWTGRGFADQPQGAPAFAANPTFEPNPLFLTWQRDPTTTMTIQWIGPESDGKDRPIWFAKDGSMEWKSQPGEVKPFPKTDLKIFRTELKGLEPGAEYRFRVGLDSKEKRFRTMPAKATETIQFVSGGDAGIGNAAIQTNELAARQSPMFAVIGGDLAYENGAAANVFLQFLKNYSTKMIDEKGRLIPMLACIGNHEVLGGYGTDRKRAPFFYSIFDGLYTDTGYASLDFGDYMSLVLLDTNHTSKVEGAQTSWLEKTLKERTELPTLFAFNHVPSYPSVRPVHLDHMESGTGADSRKFWTPLFERYNVDAVFEHHDHAYKRTHPMLDGRIDPNGIVYLGDGSWGKIRRPHTTKDRPYLAVSHESYHLSVHRIEGKQRFHVALSEKGKIVDVCMTTKRSQMKGTTTARS